MYASLSCAAAAMHAVLGGNQPTNFKVDTLVGQEYFQHPRDVMHSLAVWLLVSSRALAWYALWQQESERSYIVLLEI